MHTSLQKRKKRIFRPEAGSGKEVLVQLKVHTAPSQFTDSEVNLKEMSNVKKWDNKNKIQHEKLEQWTAKKKSKDNVNRELHRLLINQIHIYRINIYTYRYKHICIYYYTYNIYESDI